MNYWDSCAIIPLCFERDAFAEHIRTIAENDDNIVTWWGTPVECCSAFARLRRDGAITPEGEQQCGARLNMLSDRWDEVEPSENLRQLARKLLLRQKLRAADALQLAAALMWANGDSTGLGFVSLDKNLRIAAQYEGFTVIPNQHDFEAMLSNELA